MPNSKKTVAVLFGGRSAEHEISIITALQAISAMDTLCYEVVPVYIHPSGKWYCSDALLDKEVYRRMPDSLSSIQQVTLLPDPSIDGLVPLQPNGCFSLQQRIPVDVYFLAFHGQYGEDGKFQGLLEMANAAYTGCNVLSSAISMNKSISKALLENQGIPVLPSIVVSRETAIASLETALNQITSHPALKNFPLFVKPNHLGSSIGISIAYDIPTLQASLAKAFRYDNEALIEPCLSNVMEINISVLDGDPPLPSVVEIPIASEEALTYEDKYLRGNDKTGSQGMASLTRVVDPKDLEASIKNEVSDYALLAFKKLGCAGVCRFDFLYDLDKERLYFNEINPIPGSFAFYLWEKSHPSLLFTEVIDRLIERALERKEDSLAMRQEIGFKALR